MHLQIRILVVGDTCLTVQLGNDISLSTNRKVISFLDSLSEDPIEGITELVPAYASLMVHYRPEVILFGELKKKLTERAAGLKLEGMKKGKTVVEVPILYGGETGPDLEYCAELEHTTTEEIIRKHSSHDYYVFMLGFAPGHPYSARFEEPFSFKRREEARLSIPGRSVVVQQNLSDLIPFEQPCGWNIIGMTPLEICDYTKQDPFLVKAGQWIRYIPVDQSEYDRIRRQVENGKYKVKVIKEEG